jgi:hypothetical protein
MLNNHDKKIRDALIEGTDDIKDFKNAIWNNIEKEINKIDNDEIDLKMKTKNKYNFIKHGSIAAALVIGLVATTSYGDAAIDSIKKLFEPNKVVEQQIEGMGEKTNMKLSENTTNYIIYYDKDIYNMKSIEGKDIITPINKAENYPEVSMTIEQVADKRPHVLASEIEKDIKEKYSVVENKGLVNEPVTGILISTRAGSNSKDPVINYYLIENNRGGTFKITQKYFVEASEGHGARFYNMLKEFKIID